jgi:hypothetical protein
MDKTEVRVQKVKKSKAGSSQEGPVSSRKKHLESKDSSEDLQREQKPSFRKLEKVRVLKKKTTNQGTFAKNLKYDHEAYLRELEANNRLLKIEERQAKLEKAKQALKAKAQLKPAMMSKGKFMTNSDARAAKRGAEQGNPVKVMGSEKSPTEHKTNMGGSPVRVSRARSPL